MLTYGVVVRLCLGSAGAAWRFMLLRPMTDTDHRLAAGLTGGCDWLAWPLVYPPELCRPVFLSSLAIEVAA